MKRLTAIIKKIPRLGWIIGPALIGLQYALYLLAPPIAKLTGTAECAVIVKIPAIDDRIPVIAAFIAVYLFSYAFWIIVNIVISLTDREHYINHVIMLLAAYFTGFLIFILFPTKIDREAEGLFEIAAQPGLWNFLLRFVYKHDGSTVAYNLLPSFHCLNSTACCLGVMGREEIPKSFRLFTGFMTVLIFLSTVFTKQHYFIDIIGGIALCLLCFSIVRLINPAKRIADRQKKT